MTEKDMGPNKPRGSNLVFSDLTSMIEQSNSNKRLSFYLKNFKNTTIKNKTIAGISFEKFYTKNVQFVDCVFQNSEFVKAMFTEETLFSGCKFEKCYFQEMEFKQCKLKSVNFLECRHFQSYFEECLLEDVSFLGGTCESYLFLDCDYQSLKVSEVNVIPRPTAKNVANGKAWYFDEPPSDDTIEALSLLGVEMEEKQRQT